MMDVGMLNRDSKQGQMSPVERHILYFVVRERKPQAIFEIGTWKGGGSTLFISSALMDNGSGKLYTIEPDPNFSRVASALYNNEFPQQKQFVDFNAGDSLSVFPEILKRMEKVDMVLFDGAEDPDQTVAEYKMFQPWIKEGSILAFHDWNTDKCIKIKELIMMTPDLKLVAHTTMGTGFTVWERI